MQLDDVLALVEEWYPPHRADDWDRVGLVCGDPKAEVRRILLAVDPVQATADEAVALGADLLLVHHPLFLKGTSTVAADTPKGRVVHTLLTNGCALHTAHTNADSAVDGVSDAIARALGLRHVRPLEPDPLELDKFVVFVPVEAAEQVREAMAGAGAGEIGDYDSASFSSTGEGRFRPRVGANPAVGSVGEHTVVPEMRVEMVARRELRGNVEETLRAAHPYEEPAYDVIELVANDDREVGTGRFGFLEQTMSLRDFAAHVAAVLPGTAHGVRVAGDPDLVVERVALCGGAGDFLLGKRSTRQADVYVTSDLRHHPASESREEAAVSGGPALVDVAHWAAESMWLPVLRDRLATALGDTVTVHISSINTDPWTFRV